MYLKSLGEEEKASKAQFRRQTFHVPNLIPSIKYMRRSTFEINFDVSNLDRPMN